MTGLRRFGTTKESKRSELKEGEILGKYRVVRLLGQGGMGAVYEVEHVELGTRYALKTFTYDRDGDYAGMLLAKFREEAKMLSRVNHPRVVRAFDFTHDEGRSIVYYVMDLVLYKDGESYSLDEVERASLTEDRVHTWFCDACEALDYVHSLGIVHRDVKLENFLLAPDKHAVLADFGVSRIFGAKMKGDVAPYKTMCIKAGGATEKTVLGTDHYIAPEVLAGQDATPAADAYSLGIMVFKLFFDTWADKLSTTAIDAHFHGYKYRWYEVIPRLLEFDPARRPTRLSDLVPLLDRTPDGGTTDGNAVSMKPPRNGKAVRPRRRFSVTRFLFSAVFFAAFVAGASWFCWQGFRAYDAEQDRRLAEQKAEMERKIAAQNERFEAEKAERERLVAEQSKRDAEAKRLAAEKTAAAEKARRAREEETRQIDAKRVRIAGDPNAPTAERRDPSPPPSMPDRFVLTDSAAEKEKKDYGPIPDKSYTWLKFGRADSPNEVKFQLSNGAVIDLVPMKAATFYMANDPRDGKTHRKVTITRPFWISKYLLTAEQCRDFASNDYEDCRPIEKALEGTGYTVSKSLDRRQTDAICVFLSAKYASQLPKGYVFRLPTEAEWWYAMDIDATARMYEDAGGWGNVVKHWNGAGVRSMEELRREKKLDTICKWCGDGKYASAGGYTEDHQIFVGGRMEPHASGVYDLVFWHNPVLDVLANDTRWRDIHIYDEESIDPFRWVSGIDIYTSAHSASREFHDWVRVEGMNCKYVTHIVLGPDLIAEYLNRQKVAPKPKPPRKTALAMKPQRWNPDSSPRKLNKERKFCFVMDNGVEMEFCLCPAGTFTMSNVPGQQKLTHRVTLTRPYLMSKYNVTAAQWRDFGRFDCEGVPRELEKLFANEIKKEKWNVCVKRNYWQWTKFCEYLTERYRAILPHGYVFRLPTEAELERAMLADGEWNPERFDDRLLRFRNVLAKLLDKKKFKDIKHFDSGGWYRDNHIGGRVLPNAWGVYDFRCGKACLDFLNADGRDPLNYRPTEYGFPARDIVYAEVEEDPLRWDGRCGWRYLMRDGNVNRCLFPLHYLTLAHIVIGPDVLAERKKVEEGPYPKEDFGGRFIGDKAKISDMSSCHNHPANSQERHKLLLSRENTIVREKDNDEDLRGCHTNKEKSPWVQIELDEPTELAGIQVELFRCTEQARRIRIWVSDGVKRASGEMEMRLVAQEDRELQRYRFDLCNKNVKAKFIRIGREPGFNEDYFALNKVLIYGKKK